MTARTKRTAGGIVALGVLVLSGCAPAGPARQRGTAPASGRLQELQKTIPVTFDTAPVPQQPVATPKYPAEARAAEIEGSVYLKVVVSPEGRVTSTEVLEATPPLFADPARAAVEQWIFEPATQDGQPVSATIVIPLRFTLNRH